MRREVPVGVLLACIVIAVLFFWHNRPIDPSDWPNYERGLFTVSLPGDVVDDKYNAESGAYTLVTKGHGYYVSLVVVPWTSFYPFDEKLRAGDLSYINNRFSQIYPAFEAGPVEWIQVDGLNSRNAIEFAKTIKVQGHLAQGLILRLPKARSVALLYVVSGGSDHAIEMARATAHTIRSIGEPELPPDIPAESVEVEVPEEWQLAIDDERKRYWVNSNGDAFFLLMKPGTAIGAKHLDAYGTAANFAKASLMMRETLAGRKAEVESNELVFDQRLWCLISRARGTVEYKAGPYRVEMRHWVDPRTVKTHRVYFGGLTDDGYATAEAIANTLTFN